MIKAVYAGSFDPLTMGHLDVIRRSSAIVDELIVLVSNNVFKKYTFTILERISMIKNAVSDLKNVKIDYTDGLIVRYANDNNIRIMIRGLRNIQDYEYEYSLAKYNTNIMPNVETLLLFPSTSNHFVSSSAIKELVYHKADISLYIPSENIDLVIKKLSL